MPQMFSSNDGNVGFQWLVWVAWIKHAWGCWRYIRVGDGGYRRGSGVMTHRNGRVLQLCVCGSSLGLSRWRVRQTVEAGQHLGRWEHHKSWGSDEVDICLAVHLYGPEDETSGNLARTMIGTDGAIWLLAWVTQGQHLKDDIQFEPWMRNWECARRNWDRVPSRCKLGCLFSTERVSKRMRDESGKPGCWGTSQGFLVPLFKVWWLTLQN